MAAPSKSEMKNPILRWVDTRLPLLSLMQREYAVFPTPKNFNYFWAFGGLAMVSLMVMIATGVFLAMAYTPHVSMAFDSVERIMRDVNYGWLLRYAHANGASLFFVVVYVHTFRGLYYGSYKAPRELLWIIGVVILMVMMATAFMGYVLPWGQMSYWGATVITSLFSAFPVVGDPIVHWLWGGFSVGNPDAQSLLQPALPAAVRHRWRRVPARRRPARHRLATTRSASSRRDRRTRLPFHPYYTIKDSLAICVYFLVFAVLVCFFPDLFGNPDNYIPANPLQTPAHIVPEWYFLPFYAILRAIPSKLGGVVAMFGATFVLFLLPWLDTSKVRSARFRPTYRVFFWVLVAACITLAVVGANRPEGIWVPIGRIATAYYFAHFLLVLPILGKLERTSPLPDSIGQAVLGGGPLPMGAAAQPMEKS